MKKTIACLLLTCSSTAMIFSSCHSTKETAAEPNSNQPIAIVPRQPSGYASEGTHMFMPRAQVYRTNGDYAHNVPIQISANGKSVISFPDPSDISASSMPYPLADGWFLDRRGVSDNTRFTRYTYAQYMTFKEPPSISELLSSVIPESRITEMYALPCTTQEALADTAAVNSIIRSGFIGCRGIIVSVQNPTLP